MVISKDKIKFTLVNRWAFPFHQGGIPMHNYYLLESLKEKMDLSFISSKIKTNALFYSNKRIKFKGISSDLSPQIWRFAKSKFIQNGLRALQDWYISKDLAKVIYANSPNVIEFMDIHSEGYAYLKQNPLKYRKTKVIIRSHTPWGLLRSYYFHKERQGFDGWWSFEREKFCFQSCNAITTPSMDLKGQLINLYDLPEEKITVIPNIIDTNHFIPLKQRKLSKQYTILHVGRFERPKGVLTLIKAFIEFAKNNTDCRLIMIGQPRGPSYRDCIKLLKNAGLLEKVEFSGFVSYEDLPEYYAKADVVVVASEIYESFSYTVAQAMACAKVVIASRIGGMPETLGNGHFGFLFEPGDVDSLIKMLIYVFSNEVENIGQLAHEHAYEKFSQEKLKLVYENFYNNQ